MNLVVTHTRSPQMRFQNWSLRKLLFQIPKILKYPPRPTTTRITCGEHIEIMVIMHRDFNGRISTRSGKISKARSNLIVFPIPLTM